MIPNALPPGVQLQADRLVAAIELVADVLASSPDVTWRRGSVFCQLTDPRLRHLSGDDGCVIWSFPIVRNWHSEHNVGTLFFDTSLRLQDDVRVEEAFERRPPLWRVAAPGNLVACLCFWLRSLALQEPGWSTQDREGEFYGARCFNRVVGPGHDIPQLLAKWSGYEVGALERKVHLDGTTTWETNGIHNTFDSQCFGMFLFHLK